MKIACSARLGFLMAFTCVSIAHAQTSAGTVARDQIDRQTDKRLEQTLSATAQNSAEMPALSDNSPAPQGQTVSVTVITVEGNTLIPETTLRAITAAYENQTLDINQIRTLTGKITALYRNSGYVTSRAFLPPQTISNGILKIQIVEGTWGELVLKGNKHFSSSLIRNRISMKQGDHFDYNAFLTSLEYLNEHPDRLVRANLMPGKTPGTTDVVLDITERAPYHVGFEFDNWVATELDKYRYTIKFTHNNLTGHDDRLFIAGRTTNGSSLLMQEGRYLLPLNERLSIGASFLLSKTTLGKNFAILEKSGRADIYSLFLTHELLRSSTMHLRGNLAFDYKDVVDKTFGDVTARDKMRVIRSGLELDIADKWGRNLLTAEYDAGIPDFMSGSENKDPMASRVGSGGEFHKGVFNFYRLQPLPKSNELLFKNNAQYTNHNLTAIEQFQIGGPNSVRGYAPAEYSSDRGYYSSLEWTMPFYGLSKTAMVPGRKTLWADALRFLVFYDIGSVFANSTQSGQKEVTTLKSYGLGLRFNPDNDLSVRLEIGWPDGKRPADGDNSHVWLHAQVLF